MILVDTSVWVDHYRASNPELAGLLNDGEVLSDVLIRGERPGRARTWLGSGEEQSG